MDGPGDYRPDNAGEYNGKAGEGGNGVRDWQRNTWFGPAPLNTNPFDEPEDAPELKEHRSENVNEHIGEFWVPHNSGYRGPAAAERQNTANTAGQPRQAGARKHRALFAVIPVLLFLIAAVVILRFVVFSVKDIQVTGNTGIPESEIIRISGIRMGDSILTLDEKSVEQRITSDYRLQFRYLERKLPDQVVLGVREREASCWLTYCGILYVMDKNRMVLYETEDPSIQPANLVEVKGLDIRSNTMVGQTVNLGNQQQELVFGELFLELKVLGCTAAIEEADISNPDSILLITRDGYTVSMGDRQNIHAKLRSLLLVQEELQKMEMTGGTINVTNPEAPIYAP